MKKLAPCLLLLTSCASIMTGGTDDILVTSNPPGASFQTNLGVSGRTPRTIEVPDDKDVAITFRMKGYEECSVVVGSSLSPWILGNILFGGLIGLVVDLAADGRVHADGAHADLVRLEGQPSLEQQTSQPAPKEQESETFEEWAARTQAN